MALKRRYYYENVFGVDQYSMKVLRALHTKYTRDYLSFFKSLSSLYGPSPQKREIEDAIVLVQKVRATIESVLQNQTIDQDDARVLYEMTGQIEQKKQDLMDQASQVKALQDRLDKIQRETGLSPKALNITRQIVRRGVKQAARSQSEGLMDFLSREAPGTLELGRKLARGAAATLAGPFAPILGTGYEVLRGAAGVAGGIRKKIQNRQERKFASKLKSYTPAGNLEDIVRARGMGTGLSGITGTVAREIKHPERIDAGIGHGRREMGLMEFWSRGAYKAKYTKELLGVLKSLGGKKGRIGELKNSLSDVVEDFGFLGAAMLPLLGKVGKFALLAVAIGWTSKKMIDLGHVSSDYLKAKKQEVKASEAFAASVKKWNDLIVEEGITKLAARLGKTVDELAREQAERERSNRRAAQLASPFQKKVWNNWTGFMRSVDLLPQVQEKTIEERMTQIIRAGGGTASPAARALEEQAQKTSELIEAIRKAADRLGTASPSVPNTNTAIPNVHDSGDALINEQANGLLGIGE